MNIILVDDEKKFINMLAKRLALRGLKADVAYSGEEAVTKARETDYAVAVLDMKMPGISGLALKQKLLEIHPTIRIIFVTGHGSINGNGKGNHSQDIFLPKPLDIDTLIDTINRQMTSGRT